MPIEISKLPDVPIITATFAPSVDIKAESPLMFETFINIRNTIEDHERYFVVLDVTQMNFRFTEFKIEMVPNSSYRTSKSLSPVSS